MVRIALDLSDYAEGQAEAAAPFILDIRDG